MVGAVVTTATRFDHKVYLPEGTHGTASLQTITVQGHGIENLRARMAGRNTKDGTYTGLYRNGGLWMSDTDAEWRDNAHAYQQMRVRGGRVLINGLGIGMIVKAALALPNVEHVDVVEIDPDVAALVGPQYESDRCTIHLADAYTIKWPTGTHWTVAWHDIWKDLCEDNLPLMSKLHRSYGRRVDWQDSWGKSFLLDHKRRTANAWWR